MVKQVSSTSNPLVKWARALHRRRIRIKEGKALIEGVHLVEEALKAGIGLEMVFYRPGIEDRPGGRRLLEEVGHRAARLVAVTDRVMEALAGTETPPGMVAVIEPTRYHLEDLQMDGWPLVVAVEGVQDPGNLGSIIRSADAAGASGVILSPGTVDPYNPKVLRSTMGSIFHLPVVSVPGLVPALNWLRGKGARVVVSDPEGEKTIYQVDFRRPTVVVVGQEAAGCSEAVRQVADEIARIPMKGQAESLNVGVAAGVILFEALRQKVARGGT